MGFFDSLCSVLTAVRQHNIMSIITFCPLLTVPTPACRRNVAIYVAIAEFAAIFYIVHYDKH